MSKGVLMRADGVRLRLGDYQVLDGVSFEIIDRVREGMVTGQVVGLLGPSGVGKTRLLRILAALDAPDSGTVTGQGGVPLQAGEVGVVFQHYPVLHHRTVIDNLELAGTINRLPRAQARARAQELLARFDLASRADYYPAQLSGGQRQRVAIAQQLMRHKAVLLLDEPFSGLDPAALAQVMRFITEVAHMDELNTIIVVTHDIRAALVVSDTLLMLGRDRDAAGQVVSGAKIQATYDLVERGLAWGDNLEDLPEFVALERELRGRFQSL